MDMTQSSGAGDAAPALLPISIFCCIVGNRQKVSFCLLLACFRSAHTIDGSAARTRRSWDSRSYGVAGRANRGDRLPAALPHIFAEANEPLAGWGS